MGLWDVIVTRAVDLVRVCCVLAEVTWDGAPEWVRAPVRESMIVVWWIVSRVAAGSWNLL